MPKTPAARQRAYRDRKRGHPPRPYRNPNKALVENSFALTVQKLVNYAFYHRTRSWMEATPIGNVQIQASSTFLPEWLEINGIKFRLQRWEALSGIMDRWVVDGGGKARRYTKIYLLPDGRIGSRRGLGLIYRSQQQTKKTRRLKKRHKLIERIVGKKVDIGYVAVHPDYVPERRHRKRSGQSGLLMRKRKYYRLRERLLYPERKSIYQKQAQCHWLLGNK